MCVMIARIKQLLNYFLLVLGFCLVSQVVAADIISETLHGKELLFQRNYPAALELFKKIENDYPDSPAGSFGQMAAWQIAMFENLDFRFRGEYKAAEKRFERTVAEMLSKKPAPWDLFTAGAGYGMRGFYYARDGRWFRALGSALRAVQLLKRLAFINPTFIDAKLGTGMYDYWRSVMTKGLNFLPFFGDHRRRGIAQLEGVVRDGDYAKDLAHANLIFIYAQERRYREARAIVDKFLKDYPKNIILRQLSGRIYFATRQYDNALAEYKKVLEMDSAMTKSLYYMGVIMMNKPGGKSDGRRYLEQFLKTNPGREWEKYAKDVL